ncbi:MAG: hypothetical protein EPO32_00410 [Anaerolineae bacterium]|nr:MAG: hypothetical protein EPO32_00410 [Anaerolineae bacterium]
MSERQPPWFLVTGLVIGLALGLVYAWVLSPVETIDTFPHSLRADFLDDQRVLIAQAFVATGDLGRAQARLALLQDPDPARTLAMLAQRLLAQGEDADDARALGLLSSALESGVVGPGLVPALSATLPPNTPSPEALATDTPTPEANDVTETPDGSPTERATRTITPTPSRTPTATVGAPFQLQDLALVCDPALSPAVVQVVVVDQTGNAVPGVEVLVTWEGGRDRFFTGLKPEFGLGYGDFAMADGVTYTVQLAEGGDPVPGLSTGGGCPPTDDGTTLLSSWLLNFRQP